MHKGRRTPASGGSPFNKTEFVRQHVTSGNVVHTPLFRFLLGSAMLMIMAMVACFSVLTTQNLVEGGDGSGVVLHWGVFLQVFDLMQGAYSGKHAIAIIVSWTLFVLYLVFGALEVITPDNRREDKLFRTAILLLLFFDGVATYEYLHILPLWYQWLFTLLVPICIGFFGKFGLTLVLTAIFDYMEAAKS